MDPISATRTLERPGPLLLLSRQGSANPALKGRNNETDGTVLWCLSNPVNADSVLQLRNVGKPVLMATSMLQ